MIRASELSSPASATHFLRKFGQSDRETWQPPEKIMGHIKAGAPYYWKVTGYTRRGGKIESRSRYFRPVE